MKKCLTCDMIHMLDKSYPVRKARHGTSSGRCDWHAWDDDGVWICDVCGRAQFDENIAWCHRHDKYVCKGCAEYQRIEEKYWFWQHYLLLKCPACGGEHPTLSRSKYLGEHPWQTNPYKCRDMPIWYPGGRILTEVPKKKIVSCPSCQRKLTISKVGEYQCPSCRSRFVVKGEI